MVQLGMIKKNLKPGDLIVDPRYNKNPKDLFKFAVVIDQEWIGDKQFPGPSMADEWGDFLLLTNKGEQGWYSFDYVYSDCEIME